MAIDLQKLINCFSSVSEMVPLTAIKAAAGQIKTIPEKDPRCHREGQGVGTKAYSRWE